MSTDLPIARRFGHPVQLVICCGLVLLYGILSYSAVHSKSPTYDEPMHALGGWMHLHEGDFRINFEDPPLWQYWAMIPNGSGALHVNLSHPQWVLMPDNLYNEWGFTVDTLFNTPGNDGAAFVNRARFMMVLLGMALCAVVIIWTWQLAGPVAAVIAAALVALDPNLIGHGGLVKNDVPMALMMAAVFLACWRAGKNLSLGNAIALSLLVAAGVNVKFSAVLFAPMLVLLLVIRALLPIPWRVLGRELAGIGPRLLAALALLGGVAAVSYFSIWICYGFRFGPSSDPSITLNSELYKYEAVRYHYQAANPEPGVTPLDSNVALGQLFEAHGRQLQSFSDALEELKAHLATANFSPWAQNQTQAFINRMTNAQAISNNLRTQVQKFMETYGKPGTTLPADFQEQVNQVMRGLYGDARALIHFDLGDDGIRMHIVWTLLGSEAPDRFISFLNFFLNNHLLPSAWVNGVLFVHARSYVRGTFLMNKLSITGWWYYFPLAMIFKTPLATMLALLAGAVVGVSLIVRNYRKWIGFAWPAACLLLPVAIYLVSVMSSNLNIGVRHVLPIYPLMYVAAGAMIVRALRLWPGLARIHIAALALLLLIETLSVWPNYIDYFGFIFGGARGGLGLLADSNLDWGQDLPALRDWQNAHPDIPLGLAYFGITKYDEQGNPDSSILPRFYGIKADKFDILPNTGRPDLALAKDHILAISATYLQGVYTGNAYTAYRDEPPLAILNGTIYLYDMRGK